MKKRIPVSADDRKTGKTEETLHGRVKQVRLALKLSQAKFCKGILLTGGHYAEIELGNRPVNPRMIKLIAVTYGVNEGFLKTGKGKMFDQKPDLKLANMISIFQELPPDFQDYILLQIEQLKKLHRNNAFK
jgi:transcriptional regulator with XRE-family HTH domain